MDSKECVDTVEQLIRDLDDTDDRVEIATIKLKFDMIKWLHSKQPADADEEGAGLEAFLA